MNNIDIKCGYTCNSNCKFCACVFDRDDLIKKGQSIDLTTDQVKHLLISNQSKFDNCTLTGGEVTIRKDFVEILSLAGKLYKNVIIQTNGRLLYKRALSQAINNTPNVHCVVNVCGSNPILNDNISQSRHSFNQLIKSLAVIDPSKITLLMVIIKDNVHDIPNIVELASLYNIDRVSFVPIMTTAFEEGDHASLIAPLEDVNKYLLMAYNKAQQYHIVLKTFCGSFPMCKVDPKLWELFGDLENNNTTISVAVNETKSFDTTSERQNVHRIKPSQCGQCVLDCVCEGFVSGTVDITPNPISAPVKFDSSTNLLHKLRVLSLLFSMENG